MDRFPHICRTNNGYLLEWWGPDDRKLSIYLDDEGSTQYIRTWGTARGESDSNTLEKGRPGTDLDDARVKALLSWVAGEDNGGERTNPIPLEGERRLHSQDLKK